MMARSKDLRLRGDPALTYASVESVNRDCGTENEAVKVCDPRRPTFGSWIVGSTPMSLTSVSNVRLAVAGFLVAALVACTNTAASEIATETTPAGWKWETRTFTADDCGSLVHVPTARGLVLPLSGVDPQKLVMASWVSSRRPAGMDALPNNQWVIVGQLTHPLFLFPTVTLREPAERAAIPLPYYAKLENTLLGRCCEEPRVCWSGGGGWDMWQTRLTTVQVP